jgi:tRNA (guanine-N7-)-methyltransferase
MIELLAQHTRLRPLPPPEPGAPAHGLDYLTNFERRFRKEGRPIHRGAYERQPE